LFTGGYDAWKIESRKSKIESERQIHCVPGFVAVMEFEKIENRKSKVKGKYIVYLVSWQLWSLEKSKMKGKYFSREGAKKIKRKTNSLCLCSLAVKPL